MKTELGFCYYFLHGHDMYIYGDFEIILPTLYDQRIKKNSLIHYYGDGDDATGRQQRVTALRNAIEILENELKGEV